jgi:hypothetical protein
VSAHPLSVSRSTLERGEGLVRLTVSMPLVETEHLPAGQRDLGRYFRVDGEPPVSSSCRVEDVDLVCQATFLTARPRTVESDLAPAVLPHHIHTLGYEDRAFTFTSIQGKHDLAAQAPAFPWLAVVALTLLAFVAIRSLRSKRKTLRPS